MYQLDKGNASAQGNGDSKGSSGMIEEVFEVLMARHMEHLSVPTAYVREGQRKVCCVNARRSASRTNDDTALAAGGLPFATAMFEGYLRLGGL